MRPILISAASALTAALAPPALSAEDGRIAYVDSFGAASIREDGSDRKRITFDPVDAVFRGIDVSPDGRRLAMGVPKRPEAGYAIATVPAAGGPTQQLSLGREASEPSWSPDGRRLVFTRCSKFEFTDIEECVEVGLAVARDTGAGLRGLVGDAQSPAWSPDGRTIAFVRPSGSCSRLMTIRSDGRGRRVLASLGRGRCPGRPAFSPDGRRLAFSVTFKNRRSAIYTSRADGRGARRISSVGQFDAAPTWSPDGRHVAFVRGKRGTAPAGTAVVSASGRGERIILLCPDDDPATPGFEPDECPAELDWVTRLGD